MFGVAALVIDEQPTSIMEETADETIPVIDEPSNRPDEVKSFFPVLASVMIVGGCGYGSSSPIYLDLLLITRRFIGSHLVSTLLLDPECGPISVVSRHPTVNQHQGASYFQGDITNETRMRQLLFKIQPRVVFHLASPRPKAPTKDLKTINI